MRQAKVAIWFALFVSATSVVAAQESGTTQPASVSAREAFRRGEAAYSAGNYETAIREWKAAYAADARPRIQFNLSQAYERLGQLQDAIGALERFLESGDPDDPTYSDANARLVALRQRLSQTGVVVRGGAEGGEIMVDETDWGRTPRPDRIKVTPGSHVLVVRWPSGREFRTNVVVPAGQVIEVNVPDDSQGDAAGATQDPTGPAAYTSGAQGTADTTADDKRKALLFYGIGGGVAAAGVGLLAYGIARGSATSDCGGDVYCNPDDVDTADRQSIVGYAVGGTLIAGGAALIVVAALRGRNTESQARTACGVGFASASCRFHF